MQAFHSAKIVTADIPDPDNFLMVLRVLKDNPKDKISIVITPRPVDLRAFPYGKQFGNIATDLEAAKRNATPVEGTPIKHMLSAIGDEIPSWINQLPASARAWFYKDAGFEDASVRADTSLYMRVSALRLMAYLQAHGIKREKYQLYKHDASMGLNSTITVGLRHAAHKPDWTWDLSDDQLRQYKAAVKLAEDGMAESLGKTDDVKALDDSFRGESRAIMEQYVLAKSASLDVNPERLYQSLEDLETQLQTIRPEIYVGGPFTEANQYLEDTNGKHGAVKRVVGMGGFITGASNMFPNQFNFHADMTSAKAIIEKAERGEVDLTLLPTECVKDSPYDLTRGNLKALLGESSPSTIKLYDQYGDANCRLFDLLAAMIVTVPTLFPMKDVVSDLKSEPGIIRFQKVEIGAEKDTGKTPIKMCWNDKDYLEGHKADFHTALKNMFVVTQEVKQEERQEVKQEEIQEVQQDEKQEERREEHKTHRICGTNCVVS